jgi:hypothetical protein
VRPGLDDGDVGGRPLADQHGEVVARDEDLVAHVAQDRRGCISPNVILTTVSVTTTIRAESRTQRLFRRELQPATPTLVETWLTAGFEAVHSM